MGRPFKKLWARTAVAVTSLGLAASGVVMVSSPAEAALRESKYALQTSAYGTRVFSKMAGVESGRTAWSRISCTRLTGLNRGAALADVQAPADNPLIYIGGVVNKSRTFRAPKKNIVAASESTSTVAQIALGDKNTAVLRIRGLSATSTAWADKKGKLHGKNELSAAQIRILDTDKIPGELSGPLKDLLAAVDQGLQQVINTLRANGGGIEIPGLGMVSVGLDRVQTKKNHADAIGAVLQIRLYGQDMKRGGDDDSVVNIGRTRAQISKAIPAGLMRGKAWGANVDLLGGIVGLGELGMHPLPCRGTEGKIRSNSTLKLNLADQLVIDGVRGRVIGEQRKNGRAFAWTEGSIADLRIGPLQIKGISGRANAKQKKNGKVKTGIRGSILGEIIMDGESMGSFTPKQAKDIPPLEIPGVAKIEFFKTKKWTKRGVTVSAVVITLLDETPAGSVIRLGNAQTQIRKH